LSLPGSSRSFEKKFGESYRSYKASVPRYAWKF